MLGGSDSVIWKSIRTERPRLVLWTWVNRSSETPSIRHTPGHQRGMWCGSAISSHSSCWFARRVRLMRAFAIGRYSEYAISEWTG